MPPIITRSRAFSTWTSPDGVLSIKLRIADARDLGVQDGPTYEAQLLASKLSVRKQLDKWYAEVVKTALINRGLWSTAELEAHRNLRINELRLLWAICRDIVAFAGASDFR